MRDLFRDVEHLARMAGLFVVGIAIFLGARAMLVPDDFGVYGHYRAGALDDNRERTPVYAGAEVCGDCHDDVVAARVGAAHERVPCESCHGPLYAHAQDPGAVAPVLPEGGRVCLVCHEANSSRPDWFPQVEVEDHAMGEPCNACHEPHHPAIE